jgi:hypothetical protein
MADPLPYNCHVLMWELPPPYSCVLCLPTTVILPYDALVTHLADVHQTTPVPSPVTAPYLQNLATRMGPALIAADVPTEEALALMEGIARTPPHPEESPHG